MSDTIKAIAFAVLTVIAIYFLATIFGKIGGGAGYFLPLDILVYLGIGFLSARALRSWGRGFAVVAIAALVDVALAAGSLILPGAPHLSGGQILRAEAREFALNAAVGLAGGLIGAWTAARRLPPAG